MSTASSSDGGALCTSQCPDCGGAVATDGSEWVCQSCGLVVDTDWVDRGKEWREFEDDDRDPPRGVGPSRTSTLHDHGLQTAVGEDRTDANGNTLSDTQQRRAARLRRQQSWSQIDSREERTLAYVFGEIRRLVGALDRSGVVTERACTIAREARSEGLFEGRDLDSGAAAAVYGTCREQELPCALPAVVEVARADRDRIWGMYQVLSRELALAPAVMTPLDWLPSLLSAFELSGATERRARTLAQRAVANSAVFCGCSPRGVAGACLWLAGRQTGARLTQTAVGEAADCSSATIQEHSKTLREWIDQESTTAAEGSVAQLTLAAF